ncbi:hypothetical protein [Aeromicrobium sp. Root472D3]|uniref:hypothetical protein n=1 Tax=Aeromicrobium sp. Root472D3 TaxID=1736540 RepID=UPI0006F47B50|nr:hypothetical protein [Aeromicrobium sp. Root472D3]KQX75395.1 hypothetical protein ASD10_09555 [Aeromicrobium sp. Root472D3]
MSDITLAAAGRDITDFVRAWFEDLRAGGGRMREFLGDMPGSPAGDMATIYLLGNVDAARPDSSDEELLLYAVLQIGGQAYRDEYGDDAHLFDWETKWEYIEQCFDVVNGLTASENAQFMVRWALRRSRIRTEPEREWDRMVWEGKAPGERAAHEQKMAGIMQRELSAARLFDPDIDIDSMVMSIELDKDS